MRKYLSFCQKSFLLKCDNIKYIFRYLDKLFRQIIYNYVSKCCNGFRHNTIK